MASLRRVRRNFRKEVLQLISTGHGNMEKLTDLAQSYFGNDVGFNVLLKTFFGSEISHAVSYLRNEGLVETVGKQWKPATELTGDDVEIISTRRLKRLRGELKAETRLAHEHGLIEEATLASKMLEMLSSKLPADIMEAEEIASPPVE